MLALFDCLCRQVDLSNWTIRTDRSALTDDQNIYVTARSRSPIRGPYGGTGYATLYLRCLENTTSMFIVANDHFLTDIQGYGRVEYRLDGTPMTHRNMSASTDNKALGLWNGGSAIPFVRALFGHENLVVRLTPFNESAITMEFDISNAEDAVKTLRTTCHW